MFVQDRRHGEISLDFTVTHLVGYKMSVKVAFGRWVNSKL